MIQIIERSSKILNLPITKKAASEISKRARGTPRIANRILKRARDMFEVNKHEVVDEELLIKLFSLLEIDEYGLANIDMQYLNLLGVKFMDTPVGVETIAMSLSEDKRTIEEFIEPYLLQLGLIRKTSRGRVLTKKALDHLHIKKPRKNAEQERLV